MILYVLVAVWLNVQTGSLHNVQALDLPPVSAEACIKLQLAQPVEKPKDGQIKIYGCVPQWMLGGTGS